MADRGEGSQTRAQRLAHVKKGPGVFVYDGEALDYVSTPTILTRGKSEPMFDSSGAPVMDAAGRQVMHKAGQPVRDERGALVMGGAPKIERSKLQTRKVGGIAFPTGEPIRVDEPGLALKIRSMGHFVEVDPSEVRKAPAEKEQGPSRQELMKIAKDLGVAVERDMTRQQILDALDAAGAGE